MCNETVTNENPEELLEAFMKCCYRFSQLLLAVYLVTCTRPGNAFPKVLCVPAASSNAILCMYSVL